MASNNPVLRNALKGQQTYAGNGAPYAGYGQQAPHGQQQYGNQQYGQPGYSDPSTWSTGSPTQQPDQGRMTIDSVVQKSAITLLLVVASAAATWILTGDVTASQENASMLYLALIVGSGAAFGLSLVNSFKRVISPALVLAFAVAEGIALGAFSKVIDAMFVPSSMGDNIVLQAVVGTFAAFAGTLAVYKFFNIKVGARFHAFVGAAVIGMVALGLISLVLHLFGVSTGLFGFGTLGLITAVVGLVLGILMLVSDFDLIERGVSMGLPERESWRMAFGLTVSLVWIYTNLLRLLAILRGE